MRILAIRGSNLASLSGNFHIDFEAEPLAGSGIFAITGPTGAGKSTLLDAVCLALFAEIPRLRAAPASGSVGGSEEVGIGARDARSILRHGAGEGYAEVDFAMPGGGRYRARWSVRRARGKADGRLQNYDHAFERVDTAERMGGTRTETLRAIAEIIGLSAEQFTRAVLLAQGDFEAFIRADANDRAALLERLTGSQIYTSLGRTAYEKARGLREGLDAIRQRIAAQHGLNDEERALAEAALSAARAEHAAAQAAQEALHAEARRLQRGRDLANQVAKAQGATDTALAARDGAEDRRAALARNRVAFALAPQLAARVRAEAGLATSEARLAQARVTLANADDHATHCTATATVASQALEASESAAQAQAPDLDAARTLDRQLDEALEALSNAAETATTHRNTADLATKAAQTASAAHDDADSRRRATLEWQHAHAATRMLAEREAELGVLLIGHANAVARRIEAQARREELAGAETLALSRHTAAQDSLEAARATNTAARTARHEAEANAPTGETLTNLSARIEAIGAAERLLLQAGHAASEHERAAMILAETGARRNACSTAFAAAEQALAAAPAVITRLEFGLAEAKRALAQSEAAAGEAAQVLRAGLVDGDPCPVCGAAEHPLSALESLLGTQLASNRARVEALSRDLTQALADQSAQNGEHARLERESAGLATQETAQITALAMAQTAAEDTRAALAARAAELGLTELGLAELNEANTILTALRTAAAHAHTAAMDAREQADAARRDEDATQLTLDRAQANEAAARDSLQTHAHALRECDQTLKGLSAQAEGDGAALDRALASITDWRALPDAARWLRDRAAEWHASEQVAAEASATLPALQAALQEANQARDVALTRAAAAAEACQAAEVLANRHRAARAALLGGEAVTVVEAQLRNATAQARQALQDATAAKTAAGEALASARTTLSGAKETRDADHGALDVSRAAFTSALAGSALAEVEVTRVVTAGQSALDAEAEALSALEIAVRETQAILAKCRDDLANHEAQPAHLALPAPEALDAALGVAKQTLETAAALRDDASARLRQDDQVRERTTALRAELEAANTRADVWLRLSDLVGDREGKVFRRFAQGLTLDRLLEHANARLAELKPRYALERAIGGEMLIQVIDNDMGGQVRGLHNLSGGERFLVSLALALGLAEMSTARGVKIETLFIDEGFGALDPASLGQALALLEHLHATGRRVGIISHVEELKERVPVKIEVTPTGRGTSQVHVVCG